MTPCMGGWCKSRDKCAHYHAKSVDVRPVERLCGQVEEPEHMRHVRYADDPKFGQWVAGTQKPIGRSLSTGEPSTHARVAEG